MAGYIGKSQGVTQVDGYTRSEADAEHTGTQTFNRTSTDGDIVTLQKDGTTVGSIGVDYGNNLYIANDADNSGLSLATGCIVPYYDGDIRDAAVDLGKTDRRWKNLYLSGGVYLGGTGSANYLDDYEEGTFTPSITFSGGTTGIVYNDRGGSYIKIGNMVTVWIYIYLSNKGTSTGHLALANLPFTSGGLAKQVFAPMGDRGNLNTGGRGASAYITNGTQSFQIYCGGFDGTPNSSVTNSHVKNNTELDFQFSYRIS